MNDLTQVENVVKLMKSSNSESEWNNNCDLVKKINNGYPSFWYSAIVMSGVANSAAGSWGGSAENKITAI